MKNERPINELDRVRQLASLAGDAIKDPTARQQLATAALVHGLVHSDRLDTVVLYTIERIKQVSTEALREIDHVVQREARRRSRAASSSSLEVER